MEKLTFEIGGTSLQTWPDPARAGDRVHIAFLAPMLAGASREGYEVAVFDHRRHRVARIAPGALRREGAVLCAEWDGRDLHGAQVRPGRYQLRVTKPASTFLLEKTLHLEG